MTRENFMQFVEKLRNFGYQVYLNKTESVSNYAVYTDGKRIAQMVQAPFNIGGINIGTVHKPDTGYGTGFFLQGEFDCLDLNALTREKAEEGFCSIPEGWPYIDPTRVIKYKDFQDWKRNCPSAHLYICE